MKLGLKRVEASVKKTAEDVLNEAYEDAKNKFACFVVFTTSHVIGVKEIYSKEFINVMEDPYLAPMTTVEAKKLAKARVKGLKDTNKSFSVLYRQCEVK